MKPLFRHARFLNSLLLISSLGWAAELNLADGISPDEAVALALRRSQSLLVLHKARTVAEGGVAAARILPDPEIRTGRFAFDDDSGRIWSQNYSVALRWSPPRPGERSLKSNSALGRVSEAAGEISIAEQKLAAEVRLLHMDLVFLDEQIRLAESSVKVREQIVEFVASQVEAGVKTILDLSVAELALADARALPATYRLDRRAAASRLAGELALPRAGDLALQVEGQPLDFQPRQFDTAGLIGIAPARRPELAVLSARCSQAGAALDLRKQERYPWLSFAQLSREFGGPGAPNTWGIRIGIDLPAFKWTRDLLRAPEAEVEQCRAEIEAERSRISLEVEDLVERLRAQSGGLEYHRETVEPVLGRAVELSERALTAGQADLVQRLTAGARRLSQQQTYFGRLHDYRRMEIELEQAMGSAVLVHD